MQPGRVGPGWGFGGMVFHESLSLLAYGLLDPGMSEDFQLEYSERQDKDGYIPYRVGSYLEERIITNGGKTSSRPFYHYINLEMSGYYFEFYSPDDIWGRKHKAYIWTCITARMIYDMYTLQKQTYE